MPPLLKMILLTASLAGLAACATHEYEPAVDMAGHTEAQYDFDLDVCREDAKQIDILTGVGIGAIVGTAVGAGAGTLLGETSTGAITGLAGGATFGAAAGSLYSREETARTGTDPHENFINSCMKQRGYVLLTPPPEPQPSGTVPPPPGADIPTPPGSGADAGNANSQGSGATAPQPKP